MFGRDAGRLTRRGLLRSDDGRNDVVVVVVGVIALVDITRNTLRRPRRPKHGLVRRDQEGVSHPLVITDHRAAVHIKQSVRRVRLCVSLTQFTRYNRLSNGFDNRFDNRVERTATVRSTGCHTELYNRLSGWKTGLTTCLTTGCIV